MSTVNHPKEKQKAALLSILSNSLMLIAKFTTGFYCNSIAIVSESIHSASDLLASIIASAAVRLSDHPPDDDHPFGHGKVESLACLAEALLILVAAIWVIVEALDKLRNPSAVLDSPQIGVIVMAVSGVLNFFISRHLRKVAAVTDSQALAADAEHLQTDVITSFGVCLGLLITHLTGVVWLDPLAGLAVAFLLLEAAWALTRQALGPLMDGRLPQEEEAQVRAILNQDARVLGYHKLRTRKSGSQRHIDLHLQLEDECTLVQAHDVCEEIEEAIRAALPLVHINIHIEPYLSEMQHQLEVHGLEPEQVNEKYR